MTSKEMRDKRMKLVIDARSITDQAKAENRALSAEEVAKYDAIMSDVDALKATIDRVEAADAAGDPVVEQRDQVGAVNGASVIATATSEYRKVFWNAFRRSLSTLMPTEFRALSVGTDAAGGYTVPDEWYKQLQTLLRNTNVMRQLAKVIQTSNGTTSIPVVSAHGSSGWTGEAASFNESDDTFSNATLDAWKLTTMIKVSEELLNDSMFDLEGYIANEFALRQGEKEEAAFVNGDGASKPTGVVGAGTLGKSFAGAAAITADELIDLFHSLPRYYRTNASWLLADGTAKLIRKLKDSGTGAYTWQPGLQAGRPDTILGRPVYISDNVPAATTGNKSVLFGDFSYYWIADRGAAVFQRLNERYADVGQVGFRGYKRVDGKLTRSDAISYGVQA
jgi:HK97 family phage major capsid protein